jgi:hypothetical protein
MAQTVTWEEYLCRGAKPNRSTNSVRENKMDEKHEVIKKVEKALRHIGLTPFSASVTMQYISVRHISLVFI